ncbi:MAG: EamA family transporter [Pseudomonadota bacterium]
MGNTMDRKILPNSRRAGVALMIASAVMFSSAGLFAKGVTAGAWDVIFWRGVFSALLTTLFITGRRALRREFSGMGRAGLAAAVIGASGSVAFITAFKLTTVASVALIYAAAPMLAALIAWLWLGERMTRPVALACLAAFAGVGLIVSGSLGGINIRGDLLALWMTIVMATYLVIYRRYPETPSAGPMVLASILVLPPALIYGTPFDNPLSEIVIMAGFGLVFALASVAMTEGAKRLPSAETALLSTLETPLAPILAWLILTEVPAALTVWGGILIIAGIIGSQLAQSARHSDTEVARCRQPSA